MSEPLEQMETQDFLKKLDGYIRCAFDNERDFLAAFWRHGGFPDLNEVHMASGHTKIVCVLHSGQHVSDLISTREFIDWCEKTPNAD